MRKNVFGTLVLLMAIYLSSCTKESIITDVANQKEISKAALSCVAGFSYNGSATNTGGNCGIALDPSSSMVSTTYYCNSSSCQQTGSLTSGKVYRVSTSLSSLNTNSTFSLQNAGTNSLYVRVVGYASSSNQQLLLSCKQIAYNGNINVVICNKASIPSNLTTIRYEIYAGSGAASFAWSLSK